MIWRAFILFSFVMLALFSFEACNKTKYEAAIPVMIADTDGFKITSDNPVFVKWGEDATFDVEIDEAMAITLLPEGVSIVDGKLTVKSVKFPRTVYPKAYRRVKCDFSAEASVGGSVESSVGNGEHWSHGEITLTATPDEGFLFAGFSEGAPIEQGGSVVSLENNYSFILGESIKIFANFTKEWIDPAETVAVPKNKFVLIYHANGGVLSDTGEDGMKTVEFSNEFYLCPNALADRGYFTREGYALLGYNTKPDGSGKYYAPGWNVVMPERGAISLYCIWAKESSPKDFVYQTTSDGLNIVRYKGNDEFVVIPENIGGKPVSAISPLAFHNISSMKSLFITKNVKTVADAAIAECDNFENLYFSDSVKNITDKAIISCDSYQKLYMMAVVNPKYMSTRNGTYSIKFERLLTLDERKLIVASGSNSAFGVNSPQLHDLLKAGGHEYEIINFGTNAGTPLAFYLEFIEKYTNAGDVIVLAPEANGHQYGANDVNSTHWQIFEGAYDAFSLVDIRHYSNIFTAFAEFNATRNHNTYDENAYEKYVNEVNIYGDFYTNKVGYTKSYEAKVQGYIAAGNVGSISLQSCIDNINNTTRRDEMRRVIAMLGERGATVLYSFTAINRISLTAQSQDPLGIQRTLEFMVDYFLIRNMPYAKRISNVSTYVMDTEYFYDADQHLNSAGAEIRTNNLAKDILAYLNS